MSYYRAALAAADAGCLFEATRLVQYSILMRENAVNAPRLLELLQNQNKIDPNTLNRLRELVNAGQYKKALKIELPKTSKAYTIRGLLLAKIKDYRRAKEEFAIAIALDCGNHSAKKALLCCNEKNRKGGFFSELLRNIGR